MKSSLNTGNDQLLCTMVSFMLSASMVSWGKADLFQPSGKGMGDVVTGGADLEKMAQVGSGS